MKTSATNELLRSTSGSKRRSRPEHRQVSGQWSVAM